MRYFLLISISFVLVSCHSSRLINRHIDKKYDRYDLSFETLRTDSYEITYWDNHSEKPPLVMLHGFGTWSKFQWHKQIEALEKDYRLIIPNLLYFGKSNCTNCGYQIADQVKAIETLIEFLKIEEFNLCGASYGGVVAIELAQLKPSMVRKMIIIDSPIKFFTNEEVLAIQKYHDVQSIPQLLVPDNHKGLKNLTSILYKHPPFAPTFLFKDIYNDMFGPYQNEMVKMLDSMLGQRAYFASQHYDFDFPILLIWGNEDRLVPVRVGENLHTYLGENTQLEIIENTAHMPVLEKSKKCNQIILAFLST